MSCRYTQGLLWLIVWIVVSGCATEAAVFGLRPEYPKNLVALSDIRFVEVDSLQPILRWESFPRQQDREADREWLLSRISGVAYDLKIWRAIHDFPMDVVYARQGLSKPFHKIEHPLEPRTKYIWTVRARFVLNGQPKLSEWGVSKSPPRGVNVRIDAGKYAPKYRWKRLSIRRLNRIPNPNYYRFKTPKK